MSKPPLRELLEEFEGGVPAPTRPVHDRPALHTRMAPSPKRIGMTGLYFMPLLDGLDNPQKEPRR